MSVVSHLSFGVSDLLRSVRFYDAAFAPLGIVRVWSTDTAAGFGRAAGQDELALFVRPPVPGPRGAPGFHVAFRAPDEAAVEAFWRAALSHGGSDEGAPGLRPRYGPDYYAAFVLDPDGHKLEAKRQPDPDR